MESCDVLIVGGGPAGSSLAWQLHRHGRDVMVLDRRPFPRDKVCAGWITPAVVEALELDLEEYGRDRVLQEIHGFGIGVIGGPQVRTRLSDRPLSYGIRRCEFDDYLLRRSAARMRLGRSFEGMTRGNGGWIVNGEIRARLVVGAGGHFCPVARAIGAKPAKAGPVVSAQEVEFEMPPEQRQSCRIRPEVPELFFCRDLEGYGWVFRKGDHLNVGLGREDPRELPRHVESFREMLVSCGKISSETPRKFQGHAYLLYPHARRELVVDGALLVGDAAGLAYPESGEGIRPAVESGLMAAETILAADGDYRREKLVSYGDRVVRRFGTRDAGRGIGDRLPQRLKQVLARKLLATEWFARRVVIERWFLRGGLAPLAGGPNPGPSRS